MKAKPSRNTDQLCLFGSVIKLMPIKGPVATTVKPMHRLPLEKQLVITPTIKEVIALPLDKVEVHDIKKGSAKELGNYACYEVQIKVSGTKPHPTKLCESLAMSAIPLPKTDYTPKISQATIESGILSEAQMEDIVCAGHAHNNWILDNEFRQGFMIGSGTGFGKGNTIAGIIMDNFNQGRKKAVWISKNDKSHLNSLEYWVAVGGDPNLFIDHSKIKTGRSIHMDTGILLTRFGILRSGYSKAENENGDMVLTGRIKQIYDWLGADFDGALVFDESHVMANALDQKSERGTKKASLVAEVGLVLQRLLPKARIIYSSATGATEVQNLIYAERLGLFGSNTNFPTNTDFVNQIKKSGVTAMELVARDLKALGLYTARSLSYEGVEYDSVTHNITEPQEELYDKMAIAWQYVLKNIEAAIEVNNTDKNAKAAAMSSFWSTHQRFFNLVILTIQFPTVAEDIQNHLDSGDSIVIQLTNTNEAQTKRALAQAKGDQINSKIDLMSLDISPKSMLIEFVKKSFPTVQFENYIDSEGNEKKRPVLDNDGNPVHNYASIEKRDDLIKIIENDLQIPQGPLDTFINTFGADNIAEVTGRSLRLVQVNDEIDGTPKVIEQRRTPSHSKSEIKEFNDDKRRILIFSEAGGTGGSFHADKRIKNQRRRIHYIYQPGWKADTAVQGFGRTHRSNQVSAPLFKLCSTNINAQKRFLSSIARRLEQLGALTKGQRNTGGQGILDNSFNFESDYAKEALSLVYYDILHSASPISIDELQNMMGLKLMKDVDGTEELNTDLLFDIKKFLNRILSLEIKVMNKVFTAFETKLNGLIKQAKASGTYDEGISHIKSEDTTVIEELPIYEHPKTKAKAYLTTLKLKVKTNKRSWEKIHILKSAHRDLFIGFYFQETSKKVYACFHSHTRTSENGMTTEYFERIGITSSSIIDSEEFKEGHQPINDQELTKQIWNDQFQNLEETRTEYHSIIKGLLLPIWNKIPGDTNVHRYVDNDGISHLGRFISQNQLANVRYMFELENNLSIREILSKLSQKRTIELSNGFQLKTSTIQGISSIEVTNIPRSMYNQITEWGMLVRIANKLHDIKTAHIPKERAQEIISKLISNLNCTIKRVF